MEKNKPGIIRKKPWNRVNLPVYSISSKTETNQNMHIITYASQISMQPKRFICGIYHNTLTLENIEYNGEFVLQLMHASQYRLVDLLGKKSGKSINKISRLGKRKELVEGLFSSSITILSNPIPRRSPTRPPKRIFLNQLVHSTLKTLMSSMLAS